MVELLAPGLWLLQVTIPIPALRIVNVYAMELADGSVGLIDCGWDDDQSWQSLVAGLAEAGWAVEDVSVIAVTHAHPDHLGLAKRVQDVSGARVLLHEQEHARLGRNASGPRTYVAAARDAFPRWGVARDDIEDWLGARAGVLARSGDVQVEPVTDRQILDFAGWDLQIIWTPGHSPGHMCLYERRHRWLFTGDHVLSRITPGIGVHPADDADPLQEFLDSLQLVAEMDVAWALPGHEAALVDVTGRAAELHQHHQRRLDEISECVRGMGGPTTWEVAKSLTWARPIADLAPAGRRLALTETQAHLVHLERRATVSRDFDPLACVERWTTV